MGRIKKVATSKHDATLSPYIAEFIKETLALPLYKIPAHLSLFPRRWPFPRGDLYHWIPVLNRFDRVLELFVEEYGLVNGPQAQPFDRRLLQKGDAEEGKLPLESPPTSADLGAAGYTEEGDQELIEHILRFTKLLLENCGNRSLYASSEHLSKLLNTTSISLLRTTLRLTLRLAQRYHTSRVRMGSSANVQSSLLQSHYNINLDNLQKIALPFVKGTSPTSGKGKEKLSLGPPGEDTTDKVHVADLVGKVKVEDLPPALREEWGSVFLSYYETNSAAKDDASKPTANEPFGSPGGAPSTPTPVRRTSTLGPHATPRQNRAAPADQSPRTPVTPSAQNDSSRPAGPKFLEVPYREISSQPTYEIMKSYAPDVPEDTRFELLHRVRVAQSLASNRQAREDIVAIRLLAIANLAYVHPETTFHQKIGQQDGDEPRPLQLAYQLAELIHPPTDNQLGASRELQTIALCALEALTKHKSKGNDLTSALSLNVNHGVLFYVARKAVAELTRDDGPGDSLEDDEWRESLFTLITSIPGQITRVGESMVAAGLFDIFVEVLTLRTQRAERYYSRVLSFLDTFAFNLRDAFQAFVQAKGLDAIADLAGHEVETSFSRAQQGEGMPDQYKTQHTDYKIAYYPQQTLRWLFKFISHMMTHGGGGIDRLLRNLMDSPRLLAGLRTVLAEAPVFGSTVWSMTVNILANFIHHEPTSYQIIAEAGLSKTFLETVTQSTIEDKPAEPSTAESVTETPSQSDVPVTRAEEEKADDQVSKPVTTGILPVAEAIAAVPAAFGAICLTEAGLNLFKNSTALESFFEVFTSPAHVKAIEVDSDTTQQLGSSFDELVRHHPPLKQAILASVKKMVSRVGKLCFERAQNKGVGAKLWVENSDGKILVSGGRKALWGKEGSRHQQSRELSSQGGDVEMTDIDASASPVEPPNADVYIDEVVEHEDPKDGPTTTQFITATCKFLEGFFINESLCSAFIEEGGLEFVLDFGTLPCLPYNFNEFFVVGEDFSRVIQLIVEQKPHLALPSLIRRFQAACDELEPFMSNEHQSAYLSVFTSRNPGANVDPNNAANGTRFAKALVVVLTLANALGLTFQGTLYNHRSSHNIFAQVNMGDMYAHLIDSLGRLQRSCVWEEILLQKEMPSEWEKSTRVKSSGFNTDEANNILRLANPHLPEEPSENADSTDASGQQLSRADSGEGSTAQTSTTLDKSSAQYKNTKILRYLLSQVPTAITPFLQALGKCLLFRRTQDHWQKQNALVVADQLAKLAMDQLGYQLPKQSSSAKDRYAYWIVILTSVSQILMEGAMERSPPHMLTLILSSFQTQGGLTHLSEILDSFFEEAKGIIEKNDSQELPEDVQGLMNLALGGIKIILTLYAHMVNTKCINDAHQTNAMNTRDRNRPKGDSFFPSQFLVELRMAVIKPVEKIWNSELMNKATTSIVKNLVEILRIVLDSEGENEAFKRADSIPARSRLTYKPWKPRNVEHVENLKRDGFDEDLAKEAQYRCYDNVTLTREYCNSAKNDPRFERNPVPPYETELLKPTSQSQTRSTSTTPRLTVDSEEEAEEPGSQSVVMQDAQPPTSEPIDSSIYIPHALQQSSWGRGVDPNEGATGEYVRVEDLEDARVEIRKKVIDRALEVVDVHEDVTFELADLISAAVAKSSDASSMRGDIGETLVNALISLQAEEDLKPIGKKIASYAHLLALILQERDFYTATLPQLKEYFSQLLGFIKTPPDQRGEESSPWIGHILLIIERLLADDAQPPQIQWTAPRDDDIKESDNPIIELSEPVVPMDEKRELFHAIVEVLPRIGKDESLALSVARVLVILTRHRQLATKLGEKRNLQRLFVMVKQLSGITNDRLQSSFMLILRHIVEDEETIRQIMRTEIKALFKEKGNRPRNGPQQMDTTAFTRSLWHLANRNPEIFVEVTNEKLKLSGYTREPRSNNYLELKDEETATDNGVKPDEKVSTEGDQSTQASKPAEIVKPSTEVEAKGEPEKTKSSDTKPPVIENPDGVIHYLLCELLTYKDVDDKEPATASQEQAKDTPSTTDVEMADSAATPGTPGSTATTPAPAPEQKKSEKPTFKADQNPIFIYRCFILQCLTELLSCYNKTKVEFVTFSRQADPQAMTPSKPRSTVLRYMLENLVPVGTLAHAEDISFKKKCATSNWAISVIVALCQKTGERRSAKGRDAKEEDEPELLFVRKFVLEHALRAFKDANASSEPLDLKYSRLLNLADLFHRMLYGKPTNSASSFPVDMIVASQKQLARIMYEKNFITTLTTAIADIDLNFPNAKRAVKYILRPIKLLTQTAIELSLNAEISGAPGQADDDEISTASSVSDMDEFREETPDLFRNSTLAMFDPSREEETESEESDEEDDEDMYGDEYGEEMDYDDEIDHNDGDVVSDEDEELEGMGDIEGLPGDVGDDVEIVIEGEDGEDMSEDDDDSADMDEDEDEDDDPDDDDDDIEEVMDEVTGDDINGSLNGDEDDEWASEDDDEGEDYEGHDDDHGPPGGLDNLVRILDGQGPPGLLEHLQGDMMDMEHEGYLDDEMQEDEDEEDEEEDYDEDDIAYEAGLEDDEDGLPDPDWGWGAPPDLGRHHHHHHHRGILGVNPFSFIPPATLDRHLVPAYRAHRPAGAQRGADDGTNPLLQRTGRPSSGPAATGGRRGTMSDWVHAMDGMRPGRLLGPGGDTPVSFISNLLNIMSHGSATIQQDGITVTVEGMFPGDPGFPGAPPFDAFARRDRRGQDNPSRSSRDDPAQAVSFVPTLTTTRWQEEGRLLFGGLAVEKSLRLVNSILRLLVPPAMRAAKEAERKEREAREKEAREEEERKRKEREAAEAEEARKKAEEAEKAAREAEEARQREAERLAQEQPAETAAEDQPMEDVEASQPAATEGDAAQGETSQAQNRVVANIRGRQVDITDLGIDLEYLEALPEDLREEVLMSQIQTQREEARTQGNEPSDISREFLDALPEDIRDELLEQEAAARRRQERAEERRRQGGGAPRAEEMDVATLFASMDPGLRQAVLMEQDDETLRELPAELAEEARRLGGDRRLNHHMADIGRLNRGYRRHDGGQQEEEQAQRKQKPRPIVQMLDKSGVATLLRLMFIPQQGSARQTLNGILKDVCQNRHNRAEVISILLSILQDGSADINAVERSFAQLSLRAKQPPVPQPSGNQKTPQPLKRSLTGQLSGQQLSSHSDMSPIMVVQQCLSTLVYLVYNNPHICSFFLAEHETAVGFKSKAYRKGKAKESKAHKYPLNALLSLLDRKLIVESSSVMEQLASLLMNITSPLGILLKKDKEKTDEKKDEPAEAGSSTQAQTEGITTESGETATITEETTTQAEAPAEASSEKKDESKTDDQTDDKKKARGIVAPEVPEYNLRLVVHILAARECSSKTFQNTLSVINNLSAIPGAKETFGKELIKQGQDLAQACLDDLSELVSQITKAKTGTDVQGMALSKFSPASSDQTKLLRVLTALDYLFDPKRSETQDKPASSVADGLPAEQKADILTTLYENPTFSSLWHKLSECLTVIRERTNMLSVATILLPLIEVLMVVCKNTTLKDAPLAKLHAREVEMSSPPPENRMESLFFKFTEEHRKILNELVRQNPKLMSGSFSVLVRNSKVLEFDNKRNFFTRRLHSRSAEMRHPHPTLQLSVRREHVFLDSFKSLYFKTGDEMKYGKLSIRFHGEEGVDAGGVTREWFQVLARQMFNPDYALFIPVASDRTTFHPNRLSAINQEHLLFFKFIGRIIGKALYEGRVLDCHFSRAVYKRILGKPVSIKDMETLDLDYYKSILWMLENDITDIITETFSVEAEEFGVTQTIDLIPNGRNIPVTEDNKQEYVRLMVEYRLTGSVQDQLSEFLKGFHDIVPAELISIFNEQELELLISGLPEIDVDDWKNNTEYHNYTAASPQIQWFWRAVRSFDKEERAKLLQFVTGTSKVPLNGFKELEGMNGFSRFNIHRDYGSKDRLPSSHTCFNQLDLPEYESYEALRQQLYTAMTAGSEYFGFA